MQLGGILGDRGINIDAGIFLENTMRMIYIPLVALATLASCGGGNDSKPDQSAPILAVAVFKSSESTQCVGGGLTLTALEAQLTAAGVKASAGSCGHDGRAYAASCGGPDGRIGIFDIPRTQVQAAAAAGFVPLSSLPGAGKIPC